MKQLRDCIQLIIMSNVVKHTAIIIKLTHKHRINFVMFATPINVVTYATNAKEC